MGAPAGDGCDGVGFLRPVFFDSASALASSPFFVTLLLNVALFLHVFRVVLELLDVGLVNLLQLFDGLYALGVVEEVGLRLGLVPHELQLERGAILRHEVVEDDLLGVAVGRQLNLGSEQLEGPCVVQGVQGVQRWLAFGSVGLGGAELDPQAEDIPQENLEFDLLVVLGAEVLTGDLALDAVERLHEVLREERLLGGLGASGLVHEVLQLGFDEGAHALFVREEEREVFAEEAFRGLLLLELGRPFLEEVLDHRVLVDFVDGEFVEVDLGFERLEEGLGHELDVVVHAGPDLAHGLDEGDPFALGGGREALDYAVLEGGRDGVEQERQAVVVRGLERGLAAVVAQECAELVGEGEGQR